MPLHCYQRQQRLFVQQNCIALHCIVFAHVFVYPATATAPLSLKAHTITTRTTSMQTVTRSLATQHRRARREQARGTVVGMDCGLLPSNA